MYSKTLFNNKDIKSYDISTHFYERTFYKFNKINNEERKYLIIIYVSQEY